MTPRVFALHRIADETGVSGTGVVAHGVQFTDGAVVIRWLGDHPSTVVWSDLDAAMRIHGHDGATQVVWLDEIADIKAERDHWQSMARTANDELHETRNQLAEIREQQRQQQGQQAAQRALDGGAS